MSVTHMSRRDTPVSHAHVTALSHPWRHMKSRSRSRSLYWVTFSYYQPTLGPRREEGICDDDGERLVPVPRPQAMPEGWNVWLRLPREGQAMTRTHDAWCVTDDHANYIDGDCGCWCHGQVEGQESLIPDPRTTTEVPF